MKASIQYGIFVVFVILFIFVVCYLKEHKKVELYHNCNFVICFGLAPFYLLFSHLSAIPISPIVERDVIQAYFPEVKILEDNWKAIRQEYFKLQNEITPIKDDLFFKRIVSDTKWKKFYLKWYNDIPTETRDRTPVTSQLLDQCPSIQLAMFSILEPNAIITPHRGIYNGVLRVHLGLSCPTQEEGCVLTINGTPYGWQDGKCLVWDDTYVHEVVNKSKKDRIILFLDINRPLKNPYFITKGIQKIFNSLASTTNRKT